MNIKIDNVSSILEKIKNFSKNKQNKEEFFNYLLEENILDDMKEINEVLMFINQTLDEMK
jgi:hypothetical protein